MGLVGQKLDRKVSASTFWSGTGRELASCCRCLDLLDRKRKIPVSCSRLATGRFYCAASTWCLILPRFFINRFDAPEALRRRGFTRVHKYRLLLIRFLIAAINARASASELSRKSRRLYFARNIVDDDDSNFLMGKSGSVNSVSLLSRLSFRDVTESVGLGPAYPPRSICAVTLLSNVSWVKLRNLSIVFSAEWELAHTCRIFRSPTAIPHYLPHIS